MVEIRHIQPPGQWLPEILSQGIKRSRDVTLTNQPHLVPRLIMSRRYTSHPIDARMAVTGQLYILLWPRGKV
jgi:hypothetical protein